MVNAHQLPITHTVLSALLADVDPEVDINDLLFIYHNGQLGVSHSSDTVVDIHLDDASDNGRISLIGGSRQQVNIMYKSEISSDVELDSKFGPIILDLSNTTSLRSLSISVAVNSIIPGNFPIDEVKLCIVSSGYNVPQDLFKLNGGAIHVVDISIDLQCDDGDEPSITIPEGCQVHTISLAGSNFTSMPSGMEHVSDYLRELFMDCENLANLNLNRYNLDLDRLTIENMPDVSHLRHCNRTGAEVIVVTKDYRSPGNDVIPKEFLSNVKRMPKSVEFGYAYPEEGSYVFSGNNTTQLSVSLEQTKVPIYLAERRGITDILLTECSGAQAYLDAVDLSDSISSIHINNCDITRLPEWLSKCYNIVEFSVPSNPIIRFPRQVLLNNIDRIKVIDVVGTCIDDIPVEVTKAHHDFRLAISREQLQSMFPSYYHIRHPFDEYFPSRAGDPIHRVFVGSSTKVAQS